MSPDKNIRINRPHDFGFHGIFKNFHSLEGIKKVADSYARFTGYVWTEAISRKKQLRIQKYPDTCGLGLNETILENIITWPALCVAQTRLKPSAFYCFTNSEYAQIRYFPLHYYNHVLCYGELSTFSIKILSRVTNIELTSFWLARGWGRGDFLLLSSPQKSLIVRPMIRLAKSRPVISSYKTSDEVGQPPRERKSRDVDLFHLNGFKSWYLRGKNWLTMEAVYHSLSYWIIVMTLPVEFSTGELLPNRCERSF